MKSDPILRRSSVVIAVALQRLLDDPSWHWGTEELLVLDALQRSKTSLEDASSEELANYIRGLAPEQLAGVLNNVKGIYHELLFIRAENIDGDEVSARVFADTNHPGADVEFLVDGEVIREVQLKATSSASALTEHLRRYPDIELIATSEIASAEPGATSSGFSNAALGEDVHGVADDLKGEGLLEEAADGLATSALVSAAISAGRMVRARQVPTGELKVVAGDVAVGGLAAMFLDVLIDGVS